MRPTRNLRSTTQLPLWKQIRAYSPNLRMEAEPIAGEPTFGRSSPAIGDGAAGTCLPRDRGLQHFACYPLLVKSWLLLIARSRAKFYGGGSTLQPPALEPVVAGEPPPQAHRLELGGEVRGRVAIACGARLFLLLGTSAGQLMTCTATVGSTLKHAQTKR